MTAKEYLGRYRACCQQYIYLLEGIEQLEALAQKTTAATDGSNVQTGLGKQKEVEHLIGITHGSLFSGIGGFDYAGELCGIKTRKGAKR